MESNRSLLIFIFGISLLPKIYSDNHPSLFIIKQTNKNYAVADEIQFVEDQKNVLKFSSSPEYHLFSACPEKNAPRFQQYALTVENLVIDFSETPVQQFLDGHFSEYDCQNLIKPIVLNSAERFENNLLTKHDIGFLIHEKNADFGELWQKYTRFPKVPGYDFIPFLTIIMNKQSGAIISASHRIISRGLLVPDLPYSGPLPLIDKNVDVYGFNVNPSYNKENQQRMFSSIFGNSSSHYYDHSERFLLKVQLAPYEDFLLTTWKMPSFMDLNTTATWKQLHTQWRKIEIFVRTVAKDLEPLIVETGTAEILTLADDNNNSQPVYLRKGGTIPVFKYMWKQIQFKQSDDDTNIKTILIVMHNDPYTSEQEPICEDVSENWGWKVSNKDYKTGLTYGCSVNEKVTSKLHVRYKNNYESFNLNNLKKLERDNGIFPSLFIMKIADTSFSVASKFNKVEGQEDTLKFSNLPENVLYNACPEKNAPFYPTYALKVQEPVKDLEASWEEFTKGDFASYNCWNQIRPIVLESKIILEDMYENNYQIGFLVHEKNPDYESLSDEYKNFTKKPEYDFLPLIGIITHRNMETTLSAVHLIFSRREMELESPYSGPFPSNKKNINVYGFDIDSLYTEENQKKIFSSIFGKTYSRYYNFPDQCLLKVQLAPHEDFALDTWKLASFMDLNTTAIWKQLHHQWRIVEIFVRKVARELNELIIETGTSKILSLPVAKKKLQSVYLREGQKFPVYKYIWKIVKFKQSYDNSNIKAILIVMHNDPYTPDQKPICEDLSENLGWIVSNNDYKTGLTYGCPVNENTTTLLYKEYKSNYASLNLNKVQMLIYDENGEKKLVERDIASKMRRKTFPSLFVIKASNASYAVAHEFEYVEGQDNVLKFSTSPDYQLYNVCPEENAPFHPTYALKVQQSVTDFEASWEEFVKGDFANYNCSNPIKPIVLKSKQRFEDESLVELDIGYLIHDTDAHFEKLAENYENFTEIQEYNFLHFLTIRMSQRFGTTIEVCHQIITRELPEQESAYSGSFPPNKKNIDVYGFDVDKLYRKEYQENIFSSIFPERHALYYSYPNQILRKVQLAPHEDFQLNTWKLASFMNLNTTAMWEQLYSQWRRIEIFVREVARELEELIVETGIAKILTLADVNEQQQPVYLRKNQKSPVTKYFWKLIKFDQSDDDEYTRAILIVMHNDPYTPDQEMICDDVSENWGWMVSNKDYKTGLTYGCPVNESTTTQLHHKYKENYESFNLNNTQKLENAEKDSFPSLFVMKKSNTIYAVADKFEYVKGQENAVKFSTSPSYELYNACPEENAALYPTYVLKAQELVTDFETSSLQQFINGDFVKYNCPNPIRPIVLKHKLKFRDGFEVEYGIGFLIHDVNGKLGKVSKFYETLTEIQEYEFFIFLAIVMDRQSGAILAVLHKIISRGLLEPEPVYSVPYWRNEKNADVYGFDVNSLYTKENQQKMFYSIFGEKYTDYYRPPNQILRKVPLAPPEDFLLNIWKLPSLMDLNTTAMWEQLKLQWKKIEIFVRKVAREMDYLSIETGAAKILSLTDAKDNLQLVYLREEQKSPVCKYMWKLVHFDQFETPTVRHTQAVLIVMHNDPYTQNQKPICDDVGKSLGWMVSNNDYKTGLTYVCQVVRNVTSELYIDYIEGYEIFNLKNVYVLEYDENGQLKKSFDDIYSKVMSRT